MAPINFEQLIARLDACVGLINDALKKEEPPASEVTLNRLREQGAIYAAFVTDCSANRIDWRMKPASENLKLVEAFCALVESELNNVEKP